MAAGNFSVVAILSVLNPSEAGRLINFLAGVRKVDKHTIIRRVQMRIKLSTQCCIFAKRLANLSAKYRMLKKTADISFASEHPFSMNTIGGQFVAFGLVRMQNN
jgi:hypothetical protein